MSPYIKTDEKKHYKIDKNPNPQQQPFNPWNVFPGMRFDGYNEKEQPQQKPYDEFAPPMHQPNYHEHDYNNRMPNEYNPDYNPWNVFPGMRNFPPRNEKNPNPKKTKSRKNSRGEPSLKYIPTPVIKDNIGKIINTYIPGYGRVNVFIKGINRDGMVHLVIINPDPKDYIYIHNSDMVGIYPPTL